MNTYSEGETSDYESDESLLMFDCDDLNSDSSSACNRSPTTFKEHDDFCEAVNEVKLTLQSFYEEESDRQQPNEQNAFRAVKKITTAKSSCNPIPNLFGLPEKTLPIKIQK